MFLNQNWKNLLKYFILFFYFSAVYQSLCIILDVSGFVGLRESFYTAFLWLIPILLFPKKAKLISGIISFILWVASLPSLLYCILYQQEFSQSVIYIIFESNTAEGKEFISTYFIWWLIPIIIIYTIVPYLLWKNLKILTFHRKNTTILIILCLFITTASFTTRYLFKNKTYEKALEVYMNKMEYASPWNIILGYNKYQKTLKNMDVLLKQNSKLHPLENLVDHNINDKNTFVLVIGESTNRNRMSLYGYKRDTTPRLKSIQDELIVFNNVYSPRPYTIEVLQQDLTFADERDPKLYLSKVNLINIMKQAGYETYWITNQQTQTKRNTMLTTFSEIADHQVYLNNNRNQNSFSYDEVVLKPFQAVISDDSIQKKFIVVHLIGTHSRYDYRYPKDFAKFDNQQVDGRLNERNTHIYNSYDNAVYYNDFVMSKLIESVQSINHNAALLYLSDHGEEVFDDDILNKRGRNEGAPTSAMYTIPFMIYGNQTWQENNIIDNFKSNTNKNYSASDLIYTFTDLANLSYNDFDATRSIIHKDFKEREVFIGDPYSTKGLRNLSTNPFAKYNINRLHK